MDMPTRTAPRQARSAQTLEQILGAAEHVFHELGVSGASTVDIAAAAGVSVGRLYYWFPDKEAVVEAMVCRAAEGLELVVAELPDAADVALAELVVLAARRFATFFVDHPGTLAVLHRPELVEHSPAAQALRERFTRLVTTHVTPQLVGLSEPAAEAMGQTFVRTGIAFYVDYLRAGEADRELIVADLGHLLSAYIVARSAPVAAPTTSA